MLEMSLPLGSAPDQIGTDGNQLQFTLQRTNDGRTQGGPLGPIREAGATPARSRRCIWEQTLRYHCPLGGKARGEDDPGARRPALSVVWSILRGQKPMAKPGPRRASSAVGHAEIRRWLT